MTAIKADCFANKVSLNSRQIEIMEVQGFADFIRIDQNAKILYSLYEYFKKLSTVPTTVFITASLLDNRFLGKSSEFTLMLKSIKLLQKYITDSSCSNIKLVFTNASNPSIVNTKEQKIEAYLTTFENVFGCRPSYIEDGISISKNILHSHENQFHCWLQESIKMLNRLKSSYAVDKEISSLPLSENSENYKLWLNDLQLIGDANHVVEQKRRSLKYADFSTGVVFRSSYRGNIITDFPESERSSRRVYNLLEANSKLLLENNTEISAENCKIGQRLQNINGSTIVVTKILKFSRDDLSYNFKFIWNFIKGNELYSFGRVYAINEDQQMSNPKTHCLQRVKNGTYQKCEIKTKHSLRTSIFNVFYYYIQVNGCNDPFLVDGVICCSNSEN